eukprot:589379-Rhodomonas_salina.6
MKKSVKILAMSLQTKQGAAHRRRRGSVLARQESTTSVAGAPDTSIVTQTIQMLASLDTKEGVELIGGDGIDSDEEFALYNEIDLMEQAQERALEAGLNADKMASKDFQKLALKIVEVRLTQSPPTSKLFPAAT